ncbi:MAG: hypothetical protein FWD71_08175 [Oscillospiraceae bacterium]|nr:hypothetical protein [Oscillospiraceae bacterium]
MKNKKMPIYLLIIGLIIVVGDALYYNMKLTPHTRMYPQLSDSSAIIMVVIGIVFMLIGIIGMLKNKWSRK